MYGLLKYHIQAKQYSQKEFLQKYIINATIFQEHGDINGDKFYYHWY